MKKICFINPYVHSLWTGGIKTTYYHAKVLHENGFDVRVVQPDGAPDSLPSEDTHLVTSHFDTGKDTITVFPETIRDFLYDFIHKPEIPNKYIFCQNQYYFYMTKISRADLEKWGSKGFCAPVKSASAT